MSFKLDVKKNRYKTKKFIGNFLAIDEIESWIPSGYRDSEVSEKVSSLTEEEFKKIAKQVLHYQIQGLYYTTIDSVLRKRVEFYLQSLKCDILKITHNSQSTKYAKKIEQQIVEIQERAIKSVQLLWINPNLILPRVENYRSTFANIFEILDKNDLSSTKLRDDIAYVFYCGTDIIKLLFRMKYKKQYTIPYEQFLDVHVFKNLELSNFLRKGKVKHQNMDMKIFEDIKNRFLKQYKQKKRQ